MGERDLLMIPGPTNVDPEVLRALSKPTLSHVSRSFAEIFKETLTALAQIFKTKGLILPIAGTGTLGAEVALANIIEPNDRVLAISGGYSGDRLAEVAGTVGARVDRVDVAWGSAANPSEVEKKLTNARYKALLAVHVDTSTGVANPVRELGAITKSKDVLFVVDTVSSIAGMDVQVDNWGIDVCFTASQKALATPPGLAIISFSPKAMAARNKRKAPPGTYYGDINHWLPVLQNPTEYFATPAVNMMYSLHESCRMILAEGIEARLARHARYASAFRAGLRSIGLRLLCSEDAAANTLTVAYYPDGLDDSKFRQALAEQNGVIVADGLGQLKGKAFRVGHMGNVNINDLLATIAAIEGPLLDQGYKFTPGSGVATAVRTLSSMKK